MRFAGFGEKAAGSAYIRYGNIAYQVVAGFGVPVAADDGFGGQGGVIVQDAPLGIAGHILRVGGLRGRLQGLPGNFPVNTACIGIQDFLDGIIALPAMAVNAVALVGQERYPCT